MKQQNIFIGVVLPYILLAGYGVFSYFGDTFEKQHIPLFLGGIFLVLKDIFLLLGKQKILSQKQIDFEKIIQDGLSRWQIFCIKNRVQYFPQLLILYIIFLLIDQINVLQIENISFFQNFLLGIVIVSGIGTLFEDDIETKYEYSRESLLYTLFSLFLTFFLALLGAYIILTQTTSLGNMSYFISFCSSLLIFMIGMQVLEEDEISHSEKLE